jgi:ubiquinone/menaquinone biosynthesis C-methylase UbiE
MPDAIVAREPAPGLALSNAPTLPHPYPMTAAALLRAGLALLLLTVAGPSALAQEAVYEDCRRGDGIGKCYMGREIAQVMGHLGATWLDRPEREAEEAPSALIRNLWLKPGDVVADVGAGTGYFALRIAPLVPQGKVLAVDVQPEMLQILDHKRREARLRNVQPMLGEPDDPRLPPGSVDLVLMVDVYHEFAYPREMMQSIVRALKPGGRVALVEYREEDPRVPIRPSHKMSQSQAKAEMAAVGLRWTQTLDVLPWQHLMFFEKR